MGGVGLLVAGSSLVDFHLVWQSDGRGCGFSIDAVVDEVGLRARRSEMAATFELSKSSDGQFRFVLKGDNGETVLTSELYQSKASAENGIASVKKNAGHDARYERLVANNGKPYFNLKASNGQIIGTSRLYEVETSREAVIAATQLQAAQAEVKDLT